MACKKVVMYYSIVLVFFTFKLQSFSKNNWVPRPFSSYLSRNLFLEQPLFEQICAIRKFQVEEEKKLKKEDSNVKIDVKSFFEQLKEFFAPKDRLCKKVSIFSVVPEYMQSFDQSSGSTHLGSLPFWSGTNSMTVGINDGKADLDAFQFGLGNVKRSSDGELGEITFYPEVKHVGGDVHYFFVQQLHNRGWYVHLHAPLGAMIITSKLRETKQIIIDDTNDFQQTTNDGEDITFQMAEYPPVKHRAKNLIDVLHGGAATNTEILDGNVLNIYRLRKGRIFYKQQDAIRLGDIGASVGYNIYSKNDSLLGFGLKFSLPTGNVPKGEYMLEPIFGRMGLWGVGLEILGHQKIWKNNEVHYLDMTFHSEVLHLMHGRTYSFRSFDLKRNGPGSKYLLVQQYQTELIKDAVTNLLTEELIPLDVLPAANFTTLPVRSKFDIEGTAALMITYHKNNWKIGGGLELWGRTEEKLELDKRALLDLRFHTLNDFAVVGRQTSSYLIDGVADEVLSYLCEPFATIKESQDTLVLNGTFGTGFSLPSDLPNGIKDARIATNRIPQKLDEALDICGAQASSAITCKLFTQLSYTFYQHKHVPTIGLMGGIEATGKSSDTVSLWSVALQASFLF